MIARLALLLFAGALALLALEISRGDRATASPQAADTVTMGRMLALDRSKGNCLACHTMKGSDVPSNVGPVLSNMKARFPDRDTLYGVIWDEEASSPQTVMPAFGKNLILDRRDINAIVDFLYTL